MCNKFKVEILDFLMSDTNCTIIVNLNSVEPSPQHHADLNERGVILKKLDIIAENHLLSASN